jgi:hypothetical protein
MSYVHFFCVLFDAQHCCHLLIGKDANKIQENLQPKNITKETEWNQKNEMGKKLVQDMSYFQGLSPKLGMNDQISLSWPKL